MTNTPMPANWSTGWIRAKLAVLDHQRNGCSTEVRLLVRGPKTRNGLLAEKDLKSGLCRPVRGGVGRGVALAASFDDGAPEGSQGRLGHPSASGGGKQEGS